MKNPRVYPGKCYFKMTTFPSKLNEAVKTPNAKMRVISGTV